MNVDLEAQRIETGVRDLIASASEVRPRAAGGSTLRAQLGSEVHARYRERREASLGERFSAERPIRLTLTVDGFEAVISGRIDGVVDDGERLTIEEVKSVIEHGGPELNSARLQVATYALALLRSGETRPMRLAVVLISILDDEEREVAVGFDPDQTEARLVELLRGAVSNAERRARRAQARARWAETMVFPHEEMREGQAMLVEGIDDAFAEARPLLVQAPTGTGKTAAALFGALRFAARRGARVFYATPKTTQHAHVAATFVALCEASPDGDDPAVPPPRAVSLHARSRLCNLGSGPCDRRNCPRLATYADRAAPVLTQLAREHRYVGTDAATAAAKTHNLCAYELAFDLAEEADLVIGDYNYIFDPAIALLSTSSRPTVVVVGEAHNLFDRARAYASARITVRAIEQAEHAVGPDDPMALSVNGWLADLKRAVHDVAAEPPAPDGGSGMLTHDRYFELPSFPYELDALASRARPLLVRRLARAPEPFTAEGDDPDPLAEAMRMVIRMSDATEVANEALIPYGAERQGRGSPGVGVVCIDPARGLTRRHREAVGTVCMSATLAPITYWCDVLGLEPLDAVQLSVPSPFSPDQRRVVIVPSVSTTYRDRNASMPEVARTIAEIVALRPGPYIVFFPSFAYLTAARDRLPPLGQVLVQAPRSSLADRRALLDRFVSGQGPRVLLAVSGGVFGEGIDLPGDALFGAMVVGPCLPPIGFPRAAMARHFEATRQAGFAYAMLYPGLQRVVQAAGRVIRREDDRGIVALIGRRFMRPEMVECLPDDWYQYDPTELVPEDPIAALAEFWEQSWM
ncbi:MAG: helicase C-terminal domain-containing protein [Myxococcota bacterium]